jgi:flagellar biosynthesis chaperone FliJ
LHGVVEAGVDLAKLQGKLGLDPTKLESSLGKIRASMTHMDGIADALSATIEASISNPKQLSADQEILRKEILTEMQAQEIPAEKLKDKASKELQPIQT